MDGFSRVIENLSMYGFGDTASAQIQTIKELLENSVDAIKVSGTDSPTISVSIKNHSRISNWLSIGVSDNGIGMSNPKGSLQCFSTTKFFSTATNVTDTDPINLKLMGKFGLGLFCVLIFSFKETNEPVRIISKTAEMENSIIADYSGMYISSILNCA